MRSTRQLSITLPNEMADMVRAKVDAGEYASESEVIRDGLRVMLARDRALNNRLRQEIGPAYDEVQADPSCAITIEDARTARLAGLRRQSKP
jgi:putative addiction module CopG family antidote